MFELQLIFFQWTLNIFMARKWKKKKKEHFWVQLKLPRAQCAIAVDTERQSKLQWVEKTFIEVVNDMGVRNPSDENYNEC